MAKRSAASSSEQPENPTEGQQAPVGKGRPTPTRKEAQAAKAQPLVGSRDKTVQKQQRQKMQEARDRARQGMMVGDERFLTARDKGPQRRYVRDYVDARWNIGEWMIPAMFVILIFTFLPNQIATYAVFIIWAFLALAIIDIVFMNIRLKRRLGEKFGAENVQSGFRWYAGMRALQFRPLRMPKALRKRGDWPS